MDIQQRQSLLGKLVGTSSYIRHYYILIKELGADASLLLCEFISKYDYYRVNNQLKEEKWFFYRREDIEDKFGYSEFKQRGLIADLKEKGLIQTTFFDGEMPRKCYYTIEVDNVLELLAKEK